MCTPSLMYHLEALRVPMGGREGLFEDRWLGFWIKHQTENSDVARACVPNMCTPCLMYHVEALKVPMGRRGGLFEDRWLRFWILFYYVPFPYPAIISGYPFLS